MTFVSIATWPLNNICKFVLNTLLMKVSLITVTRNSEKFLESCIQSVLNQDHTDIEHIIIDGCSTDSTISIIKRYEANIDTWISEPDQGMYDAINKGMSLATGDIIGTLNSDDLLASPDVISNIVKAFKQNKVDAVYGDLQYVQQDNLDKVIREWKGVEYRRTRFTYGWMPAHPTFYFRRSLLDTCGYYETHFFTASDYEFMTRYLYEHQVKAMYIPQLMVTMRMGGMSNGTLVKRLRANRRDYLAMKKNHIPFPMMAAFIKPLLKLQQYKAAPAFRLF